MRTDRIEQISREEITRSSEFRVRELPRKSNAIQWSAQRTLQDRFAAGEELKCMH